MERMRELLDEARDAMAAAEAQLVSATNKACREERCYAEAKDCPKRAAILRMRAVVERIDAALVESESLPSGGAR